MLLRDLRPVRSTSGSVSDALGVLVVLRRLGVLVRRLEVDGAASVVSVASSDLLFLLRGVLGGGINCLSPPSSPSTALSWLLGTSVMPLLVRRTLACALSNLEAFGKSSCSTVSSS